MDFIRGFRGAFWLSILFWTLVAGQAYAQSGGSTTRPTWFDGSTQYYISTAHPLPVTGSFSASGFAPATTGTPISVTTGGVTGSLPAGTVVVATNVGTTNGAYCKLGASATTSDQYIAPNGGWFSFTVGAATQLTCITSTSTTTVNMVGGSGIATGTGGGGGSGIGGLSVAFGGAIGANGTPGGFQDGSGNFQAFRGTTANGLAVDCGASSNTLCGLINSPPPLNINGVNQAWTGLTPGVAQTGTIYAANADLSSVKGTATDTNSGNKSAGTIRVVLATDQPSLSNAQPANIVAYAGSAVGVSNPMYTQGSDGTNTALVDPCQSVAKTYTPINISSSGSAKIITGTSAKKTYICHLNLVTNAANNVVMTEGTGSNCGTNTAGVVGGTTAASGWNFGANGSIALGNGGSAAIGTATNADDVCLNPSASTQLSGHVVWVQR